MKKSLFIFLVLAFFVACVGGRMEQIGKDYDFNKTTNESIVFGKIDIKENIIGFSTLNQFSIYRKDTSTKNFVNFSRDEYFFIPLEPGEYEIEDVNCGFGLSGAMGMMTHKIPVHLSFSVGANEIIYIGKIFVKYKATGNGPVEEHAIIISDEYDMAVKEFRKLYPTINNPTINKDIKKNIAM